MTLTPAARRSSLHALPRRAPALLLAMGLAAGCKPAPQPPAVEPPPAGRLPASATMNPADLADVSASYACDGSNRVDVIRGKVARVALSDGRVVKLEQIEGSVPSTFMDNGLSFVVRTPQAADLSDNNDSTLQCLPTHPPGHEESPSAAAQPRAAS